MRKYKRNTTNVGIKKEIDSLGRIVIPKEMRILFNLKDIVEVVATQEGILIRNPEYTLVKLQRKTKKT